LFLFSALTPVIFLLTALDVLPPFQGLNTGIIFKLLTELFIAMARYIREHGSGY